MLRLTKPWFTEAEELAVRDVLRSGWLAEGQRTIEFEGAVARYVDAKFAVAFCNATVALEMCLRAHGISKERVLMPDFTHPATALAIINSGNNPVLCDVSTETYNIGDCNGSNVSMPVSWGGNPLTKYPRTLIIEDAACSLGSSVDGVKTGACFTTVFSFHPRKIITTGEGGIVTTNDREMATHLRSLKRFGRDGGNYRFNDVSAAIGLVQLGKIEQIIKVRREQAEIYNELLKDVEGVRTPVEYSGARHTYQTYAVYVDGGKRDLAIKRLAERGIESQIGTYALHRLPQFRRLRRVSKLENSSLLYDNLLALPMPFDMTFDEQKGVVAELKNALA